MEREDNKPGMVGVRLEGELMAEVRQEARREHRTLAGMLRVFVIEAIEARKRKQPDAIRVPWTEEEYLGKKKKGR